MSDTLRDAFAKHSPTLEAELSLGDNNPNFLGSDFLTARHAWRHFQAGYLAAHRDAHNGSAYTSLADANERIYRLEKAIARRAPTVALPPGWQIDVTNDLLGTVIITAPNGYTAVTTSISSNPANVLRMLALAATQTPAAPDRDSHE